MLSLKVREKSFSNVRSFIGTSGGSLDNFYRRMNVTAHRGQEEYLYRGIYMSIGHQYNYMDYKVGSIRENDTNQPNCEDIGLHGEYLTNWQEFLLSGGRLSFTDGNNQVSVFVEDTAN